MKRQLQTKRKGRFRKTVFAFLKGSSIQRENEFKMFHAALLKNFHGEVEEIKVEESLKSGLEKGKRYDRFLCHSMKLY